MNCIKCGYEISESDNFCGNCGKLLSFHNSAEGNSSVNIAGHNAISDSYIHVGDVYPSESKQKQAYIVRTYIRPVTLGGSPVKTSWLILSGLIGFIGSLVSIFSVLGSSWDFLLLIVLALSLFLLLNGVILRRTRFTRLKWFNLESNKDSEVFLTKISGNCPKCDGTLKLVDLEVSPNSLKTFVRCSRNSEHIWNFDPTVLD